MELAVAVFNMYTEKLRLFDTGFLQHHENGQNAISVGPRDLFIPFRTRHSKFSNL